MRTHDRRWGHVVFPIVILAAAAMLPWPSPGVWAQQAAEPAEPADLARPEWQVGDSWVIETLTRRVQARTEEAEAASTRLQWEFRVANVEKVAGSDCFRVDIQCLAAGRVRPKSTIWCDKQTLFLRQFQTQVAFQGRYRTIQESYAVTKGPTAPVVAFVNALPLAMPAFMPPGAKAVDSFSHTSQPLPAGAKDPGTIRFLHETTQQVRPAGAKAIDAMPRPYAKYLGDAPITEVTLEDQDQSVRQLWQPGSPWPVYVENEQTRAWLVSTSTENQ